MDKRYEIRVNVKPEMHDGQMKYYWQIVQITHDGVYTVKHGWVDNFTLAICSAHDATKQL